MRSMGWLPEERCTSEAFCSNIKLKNASILAINSYGLHRLLASSLPDCKPLNALNDIIVSEIKLRGSIPFARFMELALYCPDYGYYERERDTPGRRGDYFTSVSVGSLFGELLGFKLADWLAAIGGRQIVEAGAHDGRLARDILAW